MIFKEERGFLSCVSHYNSFYTVYFYLNLRLRISRRTDLNTADLHIPWVPEAFHTRQREKTSGTQGNLYNACWKSAKVTQKIFGAVYVVLFHLQPFSL